MRPVIGVDIMGGDQLPILIFRDVIQRLNATLHPATVRFYLTKDLQKEIELESFTLPKNVSIEMIPCETVVDMDEDPLIAVRKKKDSTLLVGLQEAIQRKTTSFITLGNTGALVAGAHLFGNRLQGVDRNALLAKLPTKSGYIALIDVGANVISTSDQLMQFSNIGIAYHLAMGKKKLKFGVVNIGVEKIKGSHELRSLYHQLTEKYMGHPDITFVGNVESYSIFSGEIDLLLSDGFTGNIMLKTAEGLSSFLFKQLLSDMTDETQEMITKKFGNFFGHHEHPGALLLGLDTIVMKCHGRSEGKQIYKSIDECVKLSDIGFMSSFKMQLKSI